MPAADDASAAAAAVAPDVAAAATAGGANRVVWYGMCQCRFSCVYDHITNTNVIENSHFREISRG